MSKTVGHKIDRLEGNMKDIKIEGTTRIAWSCLTEREKMLLEKVNQILDRQRYGPPLSDDEIKENLPILLKHWELLTRRIIDLFQQHMKEHFRFRFDDGEDAETDFIFTLRFWWFLNEMRRHTDQVHEERELSKKYPDDFDAFCKAYNEWEKTRENQTPLWTRESFERFVEPMFKKWEEYLQEAEP